MPPNILFILVDGLRADQFYGDNRTCKTPNIDSLIKKGINCKQAVSSVDGTVNSLNTVFNGTFQVGDSVRNRNLIFNKNNFLDLLKNNGYNIYGVSPGFTLFNSLREYFQNKNNCLEWPIETNMPPETLSTGLTKRYTEILESKKTKEPFFCYFHIFDLHPLREGKKPVGIENFDNEKFGSNMYARTVSSIDFWLGEILKKIDLKKTILIITADHGERIPFENKGYSDFQPEFNSVKKIGEKFLPHSAHNIGGKFLGKIKNTVGKAKISYSNIELTSYEKRSRDPYFTLSLFDEMLRIPLLFVGTSIKHKIIEKQFRHVDIFPTICELIGLKSDIKTNGKSLTSILNENVNEESPNYLHTMGFKELSALDSIGLRTINYKYFRASRNSKENVNLYDLKNDPLENNNIAKDNPELIEDMEKKLSEIISNTSNNYEQNNIGDDEEERIRNELTKLGYM